MDLERTRYRRVRALTGGATPLALAVLLLALAVRRDGAWEPAAQAAGICRELIAGSTEGRQALFGSCWVAPLPVLFYLPFAWLLPEPAAGWAAFVAAWLFVFWAVREALKATGHSAGRIVLTQAAVAALLALAGPGDALGVATALTAGLALLAAASLADWTALRRLRDAVAAGAAGAFLMLCGLPAFGPALLAVGLVPLAACGDRESRGRFQAWLLLGGLPLLYAAGVWVLLNRLVLGDAFYFLRSAAALAPGGAAAWLALALPPLVLLPALVAAWTCDARGAGKGGGAAAGAIVLLGWVAALVLCGEALELLGAGWSAPALRVCALAALAVALGRLPLPVWALAPALAAAVVLGRFWQRGGPPAGAEPAAPGAEVCGAVEAYVNARTPYGRVFVLGYAGLELLRGYAGERLVPNLDLHVGALRRAYKGQNLYVLVPKPEGAVRAESVFWKYPDIYTQGADRLLFAEAFGAWHLFEVVTAPTREQLEEWRRGGR